MTIFEISSLTTADGFANVEPFVYEIRPGGLTLASYWTTIFLAPDESRAYSIVISSFIRNFNVNYILVTSYVDCVAQVGSFYWDNTNQVLYVHFEHDQEGWTDTYEAGSFTGFSDTGILYLDNQEYIPLIESVPSISQQQDIINYDLPAFVNGTISLNNKSFTTGGVKSGQLDRFILENVYGNNATLYYYPDDKISRTLDNPNSGDRTHLVPLAPFYVEDYGISLQSIDLRVQDIRKSDNITIPTDLFLLTDYADIGEIANDVIPVMYGQVREAKAINTNEDSTSGAVNYRVALLLTVLGTVQAKIDNIWTTLTPTSSTLTSGEFVLSEFGDIGATSVISDNGNGQVRITNAGAFATTIIDQNVNCVFTASYDDAIYKVMTVDGSDNYIDINLAYTTAVPTVTASVYNSARNANGSIRECRVLLPTGIAITYTTDIIKDLYDRYKDLTFIASNFDTTEWGVEETALTTGGIVFDKQIRLFEAIKQIQNGSVVGFRFEINASSLRTFRIDDPSRTSSGTITPVDIANRDDMPVDTDSDQVFADVVVSFNKSFNSGKYQRVNNDSLASSVLARYRDQKTLTVTTILNSSTDADSRALADATKFSEIPKIMTLELMGGDFLPIRIYDIYDIEATPGDANADDSTIIGREYYGFTKGKVVGISPDIKNVTNTVKFQLED